MAAADVCVLSFADAASTRPNLLAELCALEAASYPADEAATPEKLKYRSEVAGTFFRVACVGRDGDVVGFVCGTATDHEELEEETMSVHVKGGSVLCIHSVVVAEKRRRSEEKKVSAFILHRFSNNLVILILMILIYFQGRLWHCNASEICGAGCS